MSGIFINEHDPYQRTRSVTTYVIRLNSCIDVETSLTVWIEGKPVDVASVEFKSGQGLEVGGKDGQLTGLLSVVEEIYISCKIITLIW